MGMYFDIQHHEVKIIFAISAFENDNIVEVSPMQKDGDGKCHQKNDVGKPKDCSDKSFCIVVKHEHMNDTHYMRYCKEDTKLKLGYQCIQAKGRKIGYACNEDLCNGNNTTILNELDSKLNQKDMCTSKAKQIEASILLLVLLISFLTKL